MSPKFNSVLVLSILGIASATVFAPPAQAVAPASSGIQILDSRSDAQGGEVAFDVVAPNGRNQYAIGDYEVVKPVGGGTWTYGVRFTRTKKFCYSFYRHSAVRHSSRVKMKDSHFWSEVGPGEQSFAEVSLPAEHGSNPGICRAYWGKS